MPQTSYHISLKGYVGGWDFNRTDVDKTLAENEGKPVNILIDSLGGILATGLSISAAFKNHTLNCAHLGSLQPSLISVDCTLFYFLTLVNTYRLIG